MALSVASVIVGLIVRRSGVKHGVLEHARDPPRDHVGAAQVGFGESREDGAILLPAGEIDVAHQPAEQARGIDMGAAVGDAFEREARDRERAAAVLGLLNGAVEVAPERRASKQAGVGIEHAFGLERFQACA